MKTHHKIAYLLSLLHVETFWAERDRTHYKIIRLKKLIFFLLQYFVKFLTLYYFVIWILCRCTSADLGFAEVTGTKPVLT